MTEKYTAHSSQLTAHGSRLTAQNLESPLQGTGIRIIDRLPNWATWQHLPTTRRLREEGRKRGLCLSRYEQKAIAGEYTFFIVGIDDAEAVAAFDLSGELFQVRGNRNSTNAATLWCETMFR